MHRTARSSARRTVPTTVMHRDAPSCWTILVLHGTWGRKGHSSLGRASCAQPGVATRRRSSHATRTSRYASATVTSGAVPGSVRFSIR